MNTPAFDPDDPRLTAYALSESSPAEREAVERLLAVSPEARAEVERTAALARDLEAAYRQENEEYWDARQDEPLPGKIVGFPSGRAARWKPTVALAWKVAAVVVALGALVPIALRRGPLAQTVALASPPPAGTNPPPPPPAPPLVEATPAASAVAQASVPADADQARSPAATPQPAADAATPSAAPLLAMDAELARRDDTPATACAASLPAAPPMDSAASDKPLTRRAMTAAAPPAASAPGAAANSAGAGAASPIDRVGRSLVRIRAGDGSFIAGAVISTGGRILASRPLASGETRPTVILPNGREVAATVVPDDAKATLCRLQIEGATLPALSLAAKAPADKGTLTVASMDRQTGATRYRRALAVSDGAQIRLQWTDRPPSSDETSFVFDSNGELLNTGTAPAAAKAEARTRSGSDQAVEAETLLRPFSSAERAWLLPAEPKTTR